MAHTDPLIDKLVMHLFITPGQWVIHGGRNYSLHQAAAINHSVQYARHGKALNGRMLFANIIFAGDEKTARAIYRKICALEERRDQDLNLIEELHEMRVEQLIDATRGPT